MKSFLLLVVSAILLLGASVTEATAPQFTITWTAPKTNVDGTAISGAITYQVYAGVGSGKEVKIGTPVSAASYVLTPLPAPGSNECVQVTAIANGVESARSVEACATVPFPAPSSPTVITISIK